MVQGSRRSRRRATVATIAGRLAVFGGAVCVVLVPRSGWWVLPAGVLLGLAVWLMVVGVRAERAARAEEALEAAAEHDRAHPGDDGRPGPS